MIKQHVPKPAHTGRPRDDDRKIINGIIYVLISGCRWGEMPTKYGDDSTANRRLNSWQKKDSTICTKNNSQAKQDQPAKDIR